MLAENLVHVRQGNRILNDVSFQLNKGRLTALIGPSGGGKSSLLRLLNRLDDPESGKVLLNGEDITHLSPPQLRCQVGMLMQKTVMFEGTVLDNLYSPFRLRREPLPEIESEEIAALLSLCGITKPHLSQSAASLSVGQQQRVGLLRALLSQPQIILLDEPTSALDRPTVDRLGGLLQQLCHEQAITILMSSHDLRLVERVADQVIFLVAGEIVERGSAEILRRPQTEKLQSFLQSPETRAEAAS